MICRAHVFHTIQIPPLFILIYLSSIIVQKWPILGHPSDLITWGVNKMMSRLGYLGVIDMATELFIPKISHLRCQIWFVGIVRVLIERTWIILRQ